MVDAPYSPLELYNGLMTISIINKMYVNRSYRSADVDANALDNGSVSATLTVNVRCNAINRI